MVMTSSAGSLPSSLETRFPDVEEVVAACGVRAYLVRAHTVPAMSLSLRFAAGAAFDAPGQEGMASFLSGLLDEGAGGRDSTAFHAALADNAIRLSFDADRDGLTGQLKTLTASRALAFELLRDALCQPRFDPEPVARVRGQIEADLRRRETSPGYVASRTWFERAFEGHPYARATLGRPESLAEIADGDLRASARTRLARGNVAIGVSGDIEAEELRLLLDATFGALPEVASLVPVAATLPRPGPTTVVPMALPQSVVSFGHAGIARADPEWFAAYVANHVLGGGGFSSRLMQEVREARGLAYSVSSQLYDADYAPIWIGGVATSNDRVAQSIAIVRAEASRLADGDIEEAELLDARTYLTGSFPLRLTNNDQLARMLTTMMSDDLGRDYLDMRNKHIEAVDLGALRQAAARLLSGEMLITVVGKPEGLDAG